jgi:NitT/TauT family transport system substrate-binding protein
VLAVLALLATACGAGNASTPAADPATTAPELRLGYFGNITHGVALVGVAEGLFTHELGSTKLSTQVFNAGPAALEALSGGGIDATFIGPNPAISGFTQSKGSRLRIIAGGASGGAELVVRPGITKAADLKGKTLASPQLANTQDVALRAWLATQGLQTSINGGGDVTVSPQDNATTLALFQQGKIDGAWVPEPWASQLVLQGGGTVLVDEKTLWPQGQFVTTNLIVATDYLNRYPGTVKALLTATVDATDSIAAQPDKAKSEMNAQIAKVAGKPLAVNIIDRAFGELQFTVDPVAGSLSKDAADAVAVGVGKKADLQGIYDLRPLNQVLAAKGRPAVGDAGLGRK